MERQQIIQTVYNDFIDTNLKQYFTKLKTEFGHLKGDYTEFKENMQELIINGCDETAIILSDSYNYLVNEIDSYQFQIDNIEDTETNDLINFEIENNLLEDYDDNDYKQEFFTTIFDCDYSELQNKYKYCRDDIYINIELEENDLNNDYYKEGTETQVYDCLYDELDLNVDLFELKLAYIHKYQNDLFKAFVSTKGLDENLKEIKNKFKIEQKTELQKRLVELQKDISKYQTEINTYLKIFTEDILIKDLINEKIKRLDNNIKTNQNEIKNIKEVIN